MVQQQQKEPHRNQNKSVVGRNSKGLFRPGGIAHVSAVYATMPEHSGALVLWFRPFRFEENRQFIYLCMGFYPDEKLHAATKDLPYKAG